MAIRCVIEFTAAEWDRVVAAAAAGAAASSYPRRERLLLPGDVIHSGALRLATAILRYQAAHTPIQRRNSIPTSAGDPAPTE